MTNMLSVFHCDYSSPPLAKLPGRSFTTLSSAADRVMKVSSMKKRTFYDEVLRNLSCSWQFTLSKSNPSKLPFEPFYLFMAPVTFALGRLILTVIFCISLSFQILMWWFACNINSLMESGNVIGFFLF